MSATLLGEQKLFGLFEIDDAGTVLYSRIEPDGEPRRDTAATVPDVAGRNFYEEVVSFENVEEFRRRVTQFALSTSPADNFYFDCRYEGAELPVRVLLARVRERVNHERTKSVLLHIRRGA